MGADQFLTVAEHKLGALNGSQKTGFRLLLEEAGKRKTPLNRFAYMLATVWWETAKTMQPVREAFYISNDFATAEAWRKKKLAKYYPYYGRGYVQLTWKYNYKKATDRYGVDFVADPELALQPAHALNILFDGMEDGWFTGKALDDFIDLVDEEDSVDFKEYIAARKIISGSDKAETIAALALAFENILKESGYGVHLAATTPPISSVEFNNYIASLNLTYFKPYEFLVKGNANSNPNSPAFGKNADPPVDLWPNIAPTAKVLDALRGSLQRSIVITSAYRTPAYNAAIGGAKNSQHVRFAAADFIVHGSPVGPSEWASALRTMRSNGLFSGGIGVYSSFVHLDTRGTNADWAG